MKLALVFLTVCTAVPFQSIAAHLPEMPAEKTTLAREDHCTQAAIRSAAAKIHHKLKKEGSEKLTIWDYDFIATILEIDLASCSMNQLLGGEDG